MGRYFLLFSCLLVANLFVTSVALTTIAVGGTLSVGKSGSSASATGPDTTARDVFLCFIPDTQNQTSQDDHGVSRTNCIVPSECTAPYCNPSRYCDGSWQAGTGGRLMRNLAYDLTGQWSKIDWTGMSGGDATRSQWPNPLDHPRCDAIISLGDNADINDGVDGAGISFANIEAGQAGGQQQWATVREFWSIIKASGIPFLVVRGNHDPANLFTNLMNTTLGFTSLPFYYDREPTLGLEYAIKFSTNTGKQFCIIGANSSSHTYLPAATNPDLNWFNTTVGCGAGLPTIGVQHEGVNAAGNLDVAGIMDNASATDVAGKLFMFAGGHYTPGFSAKTSSVLDGFTRFRFGTDFQECNRHDEGFSNLPYGFTPSDGGGDYYTVVRISPQRTVIDAWDWSPYWVTTNGPPNGGSCATTSRSSTTFDFDARFP